VTAEPLTRKQLGVEMRAATHRIERNLAEADELEGEPVRAGRWVRQVLDDGRRLQAVHNVTGTLYPLDLRADLDPENQAIIICRRMQKLGAGRDSLAYFLRAFGLEDHAEKRLLRNVRDLP
jgi:hypothetical protein